MVSLPLYFFSVFVYFAMSTGRIVRRIWTNESSKRVVLRKEVHFDGLNDVPLNFGGKILKNWNFGVKPAKTEILP